MKTIELSDWLGASPKKLEDMLERYRTYRSKLLTREQLQTLLKVSNATVRRLPISPRQGGGHGIRAKYHLDDLRSYLSDLNPETSASDLLPLSGEFMTPEHVSAFLELGGVAIATIALPSIRITPTIVRYREEDVASAVAALNDGSELAELISSPWSEEQ